MPGCAAAAQNLDILAQVRRELQKEGYLKTPKVFIDPTCSGDMPRLQRIVSQLGGELMPTESAHPSSSWRTHSLRSSRTRDLLKKT